MVCTGLDDDRVQTPADYADRLPAQERERESGAFFGSIHKTLSHLLWADRVWMSRFSDLPAPGGGIPQSTTFYPDWEMLKRERASFDATIIAWADQLDPSWLGHDQTWFSGAAKREITRPRELLVTHFFNHQTHHRGQVHCMLTQAGERPQDTDLILLKD